MSIPTVVIREVEFMASLAQKGVIVPTGKRMVWLDGRNVVSDKGGLPHCVLLDRYANGPGYLRESDPVAGYFPALGRELVAHPERGDKFRNGNDIIDAQRDKAGRLRVLPWSEISRLGLAEAIIGPNVGLLIDPGIKPEAMQVEKYGGGEAIIAHPESIVVVTSFIQRNRGFGRADPNLGIPVDVAPTAWRGVPDQDRRYLYRTAGTALKPVVFGVFNRYQCVYVDTSHDFPYGIAHVDLTKDTPLEADTSKLGTTRNPGRLVLTGSDVRVEAARRLLESHGLLLESPGSL